MNTFLETIKIFFIAIMCCTIKGDDIDNQVYIKPRRPVRLDIKNSSLTTYLIQQHNALLS
jgi:hypothetical protein